jgi:hypothetical protein
MLRRSHKSNNTSSRPQWEEYSGTLELSEERHREPKHSRRRTERPRKESRVRNLNSSLLTVNEVENIVQDTLEAALVAGNAYLLTTQPEPGDSRESMHQATIKSLGLIRRWVEAQIFGKGGNTTRAEGKKKPKVPISANPKIQFTLQEKLQGAKGRCKEHHHTG